MQSMVSWVAILVVAGALAAVQAEPVPLSAPVARDVHATSAAKPPYASSADPSETSLCLPDWYQSWIAGRLDVGLRSLHYSLDQVRSGTKFEDSFLGSITELEVDQDSAANKFFIQYRFCPHAGVGLSFDRLDIVTFDVNTQSDGTVARNTDGTLEAKGVIYYVMGCYPNETPFTPYAELGYVNYGVSFEEDPAWSEDGLRTMEVGDSSGWVLALGVDARIWKQLSAGLYYRRVDADRVEAEAYTAYGDEKISKPGDGFPLKHDAYGLTVKYTF